MRVVIENYKDKNEALKRAEHLANKEEYQSANVYTIGGDRFGVSAPADNLMQVAGREIMRFFIEWEKVKI